jgi:multisubunit Na+/H+ antiporter MnhE subunit
MLIKKYAYLIVSLNYSVSSLLSKNQIKNHFRNTNNKSSNLQRRTISNSEVNSDNFESKMGFDISANLTPSSEKIEINQKRNKLIISSIISVSYMSIIVSVMALPVSLSGLSADKSFYSTSTSSSFMSFIISVATIATMLGKFLLGPPTDYFGKWTRRLYYIVYVFRK